MSPKKETAQKFNTRYATLGFSEANLDKGAMSPTSFALKELTAAERQRSPRVKKAVS